MTHTTLCTFDRDGLPARGWRLALLCACLLLAGVGAASAQQLPAEQLGEAKRLFETLNYEQAATTLDRLVAGMPTPPIRDAALVRVFAAAYELRARARFFLGDVDGAKSDFRALVRIAPGYQLSQVSAKVKAVYDEVVKTSLGQIVLNLTPADADLELDGVPFDPVAGPIPVSVGSHTISARRSGCRPASQNISVVAGAAQEVVLVLERVSASLQLVTVPPAVEIVVDGAGRGRTEAGPLPATYAEWPARLGVPADSLSKPFTLDDLPQGAHVIQFQLGCHTTVERRLVVDKLDDFRLDPVKLEKAVASVYVDTPTTGVTVLLDGEPRGPAPLSLDDVCEGAHVVEMRSPWGRYLQRLTARTGDKLTVQGTIKPAVALLAVNGLPDGYRGPDLRLGIERALAGARSLTFFAPPADRVQQALKAESLAPGWLAFDRSRRPMGAAASAITDAARLDIARRLGTALEVQALAEATVRPGGDRNEYLLTILSADSAQPDVIELTLENAASINSTVLRLDALPPFYRPSVGLSVADVLDVAGAVVIGVDAGATHGLSPGDVIVQAGGKPVADAAGFNAALASRQANDKLAIEARDRAGTVRRAELAVTLAPRLLAMSDQSWMFNSLVLALRSRLVGAGGQADDPIVRLNLAVALMRVGNWADARAELGRVRLAPGPGVSNGTVEYLVGLCSEALGQPAEAERAWRAAAADVDSLLTEDGPPVKELAERKLAALGTRR